MSQKRGKWGVLYITSVAMFIMTIDTTMMNVSISALVRDLNTTVQGIQLTIALYTLVLATFMIIGAKLADVWGTKKVFVVGLAIFGIGTTMATLAPNLIILIVGWSILEGIGGALMTPVTVNYITKEYTGRDRGYAFAVWGAVAGAAAAFGPILGGFFTTYITWRLGFGMEVFIVIAIFIKINILRDYPPSQKIKLDIIGGLLVGAGLFLVTLSVLMIDPLGQTSVIGIFITGILILIAFALYERRLLQKGKDALIDLNVFKSKTFVVGNLVSIFFQIPLAGILFSLPVFLQIVAGYNAMYTGLSLLPLSIMVFIFSIYGQKFLKYISARRIIQIGMLLALVGLILLMLSFSPEATGWDLAFGLAFYGAGLGLIFSQINHLTMSGVETKYEAEASGIFNSQKNLGMSLGTAFIGVILVQGMINSVTREIYLSSIIPGASKEEIREKLVEWLIRMRNGEIQIPPEYIDEINKISKWALAHAMESAMIYMIVVLIIAAILSMLLPRNPGEEKK